MSGRLPSVSVVVPTYRRASALSAALAPLLGDPSASEVIVVHDRDDEETAAVLSALAVDDPRLRPTPVTNTGPAASRAAGARRATGDIVLFVDDDVVAEPGLVTGHARRHAERDGLVVVGYMPVALPDRRRAGDFAEWIYAEEYERRVARWEEAPEGILETLWMGNVSLPRADVERIGVYNPDAPRWYHEDQDFGLRCRRAGLVGRFDRQLASTHHHRRDFQRFRRDARNQGAGSWRVRTHHADVLGPPRLRHYEQGLPPGLGLLVRATGASFIRAPVTFGLSVLVRAAGLARSWTVQAGAARLLRRVEARAGAQAEARRRGVLIIVQNLPVPLDRRVWQECRALVAAGYQVSVVCPKGPDDPSFERLDGVSLYKYAPPPPSRGVASYLWEFAYCWLRTAGLAVKALTREGFDAVQACNPPDTYFALAAPLKLLGKRFVYDQHDLCPEMYEARFDRPNSALLQGLRVLERATYRLADHVVSPNDSYRSLALARGGVDQASVTVVRSAPDPERMRPAAAHPELKEGRAHLACWLGIMGPQDGVDELLRAAACYVHDLGRGDCTFALLGFGDDLERLQALARELGVDRWVTFTGWADNAMVRDYLSTADVGICPDPRTVYSDLSTLNKPLEYMAYGVPVLTTDLTETRVSVGPAGRVVPPGDPAALAVGLAGLLDDADARREMGRLGRERIEGDLGWPEQARRYVEVYRRVLGG